jgi:hypothetical protein
MTINQGPGNDTLYLVRSNLKNLTINSDVQTRRGGNDTDILRYVIARGLVSINTGEGDDSVKALEKSSFDAGFTLDLGNGSNDLFADLSLKGDAHILGGADHDNIIIGTIAQGALTIDLGDSFDRLIASVTGDADLTVSLGSGNDGVRFGSTRITSMALDGGDGFDSLTRVGSNDFGTTSIVNIEEDLVE